MRRTHVSRTHLSRIHVSRPHVTKTHVNKTHRVHVSRPHVTKTHNVSRTHVSKTHVSRTHVSRTNKFHSAFSEPLTTTVQYQTGDNGSGTITFPFISLCGSPILEQNSLFQNCSFGDRTFLEDVKKCHNLKSDFI